MDPLLKLNLKRFFIFLSLENTNKYFVEQTMSLDKFIKIRLKLSDGKIYEFTLLKNGNWQYQNYQISYSNVLSLSTSFVNIQAEITIKQRHVILKKFREYCRFYNTTNSENRCVMIINNDGNNDSTLFYYLDSDNKLVRIIHDFDRCRLFETTDEGFDFTVLTATITALELIDILVQNPDNLLQAILNTEPSNTISIEYLVSNCAEQITSISSVTPEPADKNRIRIYPLDEINTDQIIHCICNGISSIDDPTPFVKFYLRPAQHTVHSYDKYGDWSTTKLIIVDRCEIYFPKNTKIKFWSKKNVPNDLMFLNPECNLTYDFYHMVPGRSKETLGKIFFSSDNEIEINDTDTIIKFHSRKCMTWIFNIIPGTIAYYLDNDVIKEHVLQTESDCPDIGVTIETFNSHIYPEFDCRNKILYDTSSAYSGSPIVSNFNYVQKLNLFYWRIETTGCVILHSVDGTRSLRNDISALNYESSTIEYILSGRRKKNINLDNFIIYCESVREKWKLNVMENPGNKSVYLIPSKISESIKVISDPK